uniref:BHLH transcription factor n=1 Tax=Dracaena cambodiana TaxID=580341 RepID=A0A7M3UQK6_9ASPA|nr:bHLH transcription factor [Dracaena cambodiana]
MNREAFESPSVHQLLMRGSSAAGGGGLWSLDNMRPITHHLLAPPSSSSTAATSSSSSSCSVLPQYLQPSSNLQQEGIPMTPNWHDSQELPESWSQLLLGGLMEEDRCSFAPFQARKMENWQDQLMYPSLGSCIANVKQELSDKGCIFNQPSEEIQAPKTSWSQILPNSSPRSCVTTSFNSSMLDFSNNKPEPRRHQLDHSSQECNSTPTGSPYKKARVQTSAQSTFKVRKEKLGDRITALHQLVSPFGKTDTASVLLEAIGYIRFLQSQIEALSSPYLATGSAANMNVKQQQQPSAARGDERSCIFPEDPGQLLNDNCIKRRGASDQDGSDQEPKKDLRSRGLCLVPVSFTLHVGSDNGADYWAPTFGGGFR